MLEQVLSITGIRDVYFWRTHAGAELDLLLDPDGDNVRFKFKFIDKVRTSKSMRSAIESLSLSELYDVHPGNRSNRMDENISAASKHDRISTLSRYQADSES